MFAKFAQFLFQETLVKLKTEAKYGQSQVTNPKSRKTDSATIRPEHNRM